MDEQGYIWKSYTQTMFSSLCTSCFRRTTCVRASAMNLGIRQYLLSITHHKQKDFEGVLEYGRRFHKKMQVGIPELGELYPQEFYGDLLSGRKIVLKEVPICSPSHGLRGHPDILILKYYPEKNHLFIRVEELKTGFKKSYILQLTVYAMILSSVDAILHFDLKREGGYKLHIFEDITLSIQGVFKIKNQSGRITENPYWFMKYGIPTKLFERMSKAVLKKRKDFIKYHQPGVYHIAEVPFEKDCPLLGGQRKCGYTELCSRFPLKKSRQLYLGKRKLLVKTRPRIHKPPTVKVFMGAKATSQTVAGPTLDKFI